MKLTLTYSELFKLLAPVIPHAGTDDGLQVLATIPVAASGEYLIAQATDRFTAAIQRVKPTVKPQAGFVSRIYVGDAKRVLRLLKPAGRSADPTITWSIDHVGRMRFTVEDGALAIGTSSLDMTFAAPALDSSAPSYPNLIALVPDQLTLNAAPTVTEQGFNLTLLTKFAVAMECTPEGRRGAIGLRLGATPLKPMVLTAGDDFVGLIMPRRPLDQEGVSEPMIASVRATAEAAKSALTTGIAAAPAEVNA